MTTPTDARLYAERDHITQGEYYLRHVSAMTGEGLHAKSAIAAELAHRDMQIDQLRAALAAQAEAHEKQLASVDEELPRAWRIVNTALATQAEAHKAELQRMQAEFDSACLALQGKAAVERNKDEALREELDALTTKYGALHDSRAEIFAKAEELAAERDALKAALTTSTGKCRGIPDSRCSYLSSCFGTCNKCGRQHDAARTGDKA
jgi:chromosome segregation ATPase